MTFYVWLDAGCSVNIKFSKKSTTRGTGVSKHFNMITVGGIDDIVYHFFLCCVRLQIQGRMIKWGVKIIQIKDVTFTNDHHACKQQKEADRKFNRFQNYPSVAINTNYSLLNPKLYELIHLSFCCA